MITDSPLNTLEKRELHLPNNIVTNATMDVALSGELDYFESIATAQELDLLDAMVDYNEVLIAASEEGAVGVQVPPSSVVGRAATGNIAALSAVELSIVLGLGMPSSDPGVPGQLYYNAGTGAVLRSL